MLIDSKVLDALSEEARTNPRLRKNLDLRDSDDDQSQRMLNALEPGTMMNIHRHAETSETVVVLRGSIMENYYDEQGNKTDSFLLKANSDIVGISVPKGQWHNLECLESGTVILSVKNGKYEAVGKDK